VVWDGAAVCGSSWGWAGLGVWCWGCGAWLGRIPSQAAAHLELGSLGDGVLRVTLGGAVDVVARLALGLAGAHNQEPLCCAQALGLGALARRLRLGVLRKG
jgi:hypothetical protein